MEKRILKSMVDYVESKEESSTLDKSQIDFYDEELGKLIEIRNYAKFLSMPLTLGMFVPTDEDGNVLPESDKFRSCGKGLEYGKALDNVIFEGLRIEKDLYRQTKRTFYFIGDKRIALKLEFHSGETELNFDLKNDFKTIEDLCKLNFELTQSAITKYQI